MQNQTERPTNFSYSSPRPVTWTANKDTRRTTIEREPRRVAIVSKPWTVHEYHRVTIVSRLLYFRPWTNTENNRDSWKWGFPRLVLSLTQRQEEKWWRPKNELIVSLLCVICAEDVIEKMTIATFFFFSLTLDLIDDTFLLCLKLPSSLPSFLDMFLNLSFH